MTFRIQKQPVYNFCNSNQFIELQRGSTQILGSTNTDNTY